MRLAVPSWRRPWAWPCDVTGGKRQRSDLAATDCTRTEHAVCRRRRRLVDGPDLLWWVPGVTIDRRWISSDARRKTCQPDRWTDRQTDGLTATATWWRVIVVRASLITGRVVQSASAVSLHRAAADAAAARWTTQRNTVYITFTRIISTNPVLSAMRRS